VAATHGIPSLILPGHICHAESPHTPPFLPPPPSPRADDGGI